MTLLLIFTVVVDIFKKICKKKTDEMLKLNYSETSQNRPALGPKIIAGLEG
jgi:hypothetical protein